MQRLKSLFLRLGILFFGIPSFAQTAVCSKLTEVVQPRMRIIIDNDFSGDPDGLFQLVHHLLSPSVEVRGIIGSHLTPQAGFGNGENSAASACQKAKEVLAILNINDIPVVEGAAQGMTDSAVPQPSDGAQLIIEEAMCTERTTPLYVVCGAGLTNIASACLMCPEIIGKLTLIWIGGQEYEGMALPPPGYTMPEYNLNLCIPAAQAIFNHSSVNLWQVPRNAYRQCIYSLAELLTEVQPCGKIGNYLSMSIVNLLEELKQYHAAMGEVYIMGDSPLVLLTALQTGFEADPASSHYVMRQAPLIAPDGSYRYNPNGRHIRVYDCLDTRLMFRDMVSKLRLRLQEDTSSTL